MKHLYTYPEKCSGCRECSLACSLKKFGECNPKKAAITVVRDEFNRYEIPIVCLQCDEPLCMKFCHQNAYYVKDGVVVRDEDRCIGCRMCVMMCPYGTITSIDNEIIKCDLCDGDPQCVKYCSTGAVQYLDETEELEKRRKGIVERYIGLEKND
jgi:Fe-S-cluster-containing hydrogenase component 2